MLRGSNRPLLWLIATIAIFSCATGSSLAQTRFEAESGTRSGATLVSHASASGGQYIDYTAVNQYVEWTNVNATSAGSRTMTIRFANGRENNWSSGTDVYVNGSLAGTFWDTNTGGWTNWANGSFTVNLNAGLNTIRLVAKYDHSPHIDYIEVPGTTAGGGTGNGTGLRGQYFNNIGLTGSPTLTRTDATVNFNWGSGNPGGGIGSDNFSVRWEGEVQATTAGSYLFHTNSDDGVRLWVNGNQIINNWTDHAPTENTSSGVSLSAGQKVAIRMEFYERGGGAVAELRWTPPGGSKQIIPQSQLYPATGGGSAPAAPTGLTASPGDQQVVLSWNASSGATSYTVKSSTTSGGPYNNVAINVTNTTYTVNGLTNGTPYYFVVSASNSSGESANSGEASATPNSSSSQANLMGINILGVSDYFDDRLFADAMKQARDFELTGGGAAPVDSNGWPTADFRVVVWHGISQMNGTYRLRFTGQATVAAGWGSVSVNSQSYDSATNTTTANLVYNSTDGAGLQLTFTGTKRTSSSASGTGITNIQLMRPLTPGSTSSYAFGTNFTTQIKDAIARFKVIRFMDYSATNSNNQANWSDRVLPGYASQIRSAPGYGWQGKGGAWEYAILLANETGKDAWICVPAKATNDYVTKLAQIFRYGSNGVTPYTSTQSNPVYPPLNSSLNLYVEYSNELWNTAGAFQQSFHNRDAAVAEVNAGGSPLNYDGLVDSGGWQYAWRRIAKRGVDISLLFRSVFGDSAMMTRVRPVLMSQLGYTGGPLQTAITFLDGYYNTAAYNNPPRSANYYFYGAGGSAYYNPDNNSDSLTLSNIWDSDTFNPVNWEPALRDDINLIAAFGLKRIAYEGGPSMDAHGHSEAVKAAARDDSRMTTEITEHHTTWSRYGGDLLVYFNVAGDFQWGFTGSIFNLNTPKYLGIDQLNGQNRADVTHGTLLPATLSGNSWSATNRGWGTPGSGSVTLHTGGSDIRWANYTVRASANASYNVRVNYSSSNSGTLEVYFDGVRLGTVSVSAGASGVDSAAFPVSASKGIHGVRVRCLTGPVTLNSVKVQ